MRHQVPWERSFPLSLRWRLPGARRTRRDAIAALRRQRVVMHLLQQRLDLVELAFDRLDALGHADELGAARQIHRQQIFLHQLAELPLRARGNAAGLVHHLREFRRCHRLVGEGIESLLHLAHHRLPDHGRVVALVGHSALPPHQFRALAALPLVCTIRHRCRGSVNRAAAPASKAFCAASNRGIEVPDRDTSRGLPVTMLAHQPPQIAHANGIDICYEIFGDANAEPLLLIMGLGAQMIHWDDEFCRQLAARGFRVIRFDNRDIGKSGRLSGGKRLTPLELLKLRFLKIPVAAPYQLLDMAKDTTGLMDVLGIKSAHLVGASMGGMIAQEIAISFPQRVRSLTSIMSTTGNPKIPPPTREASAMLMAPPPATKEEYFERFAKTWKVLRVGSFPEDEALDRSRAERTFERGLNPAGVGRQLRAILASGSRKQRLASVTASTLVIHGTVDPLVRPEGGKDTAASIPGAKLLMIEGMGHALPIPMWPEIIDAIDKHAHGATAQAA